MILGEGQHGAAFTEKGHRMANKDERVQRLLDQLENPGATAEEIELIEKKIQIIKSLDE